MKLYFNQSKMYYHNKLFYDRADSPPYITLVGKDYGRKYYDKCKERNKHRRKVPRHAIIEHRLKYNFFCLL